MAQKKTAATSVKAIEDTAESLAIVRAEIGKVIFGQDDVIDMTLTTMLAGGHALFVGVPGLAKTLLVRTIGQVMKLDTNRIQCTPDLMPADILGTEVLEEGAKGKRAFRFIEGPVFTQFLMADEINRASPRTQSALLQAMQEYTVTVAGHPHELPQPFHVLATQNPIEQEGTYPLPEAQLDRFLMQINVGYPDADAERRVLLETTGSKQAKPKAVFTAKKLQDAQKIVRDIPVGDNVADAILKLVRQARPDSTDSGLIKKYIAWPPGPRASQALVMACKARALLDSRLSPSVDDVKEMAAPVLRHRMATTFSAQADGHSVDSLITTLTDKL